MLKSGIVREDFILVYKWIEVGQHGGKEANAPEEQGPSFGCQNWLLSANLLGLHIPEEIVAGLYFCHNFLGYTELSPGPSKLLRVV